MHNLDNLLKGKKISIKEKKQIILKLTVKELQYLLKKLKLSTVGKKIDLIQRLKPYIISSKSVSVKASSGHKRNLNTILNDPLAVFYISLFFQNPKSNMAKAWLKTQNISISEAEYIYNKIKKQRKCIM